MELELELNIRFYKSASGKQNMWLEKNHEVGTRYEIDSVENACDIIENIMKEFMD